MAEDLNAKLEAVVDRESFLTFVKALIADRKDGVAKEKISPSSPWSSGSNDWEHGTIEAYLEAAVACAEDSQRIGTEILNLAPSWKSFATFLYCGKIYE